MKKVISIFFILFVFFITGCATTENQPLPADNSNQNIEKPKSDYINTESEVLLPSQEKNPEKVEKNPDTDNTHQEFNSTVASDFTEKNESAENDKKDTEFTDLTSGQNISDEKNTTKNIENQTEQPEPSETEKTLPEASPSSLQNNSAEPETQFNSAQAPNQQEEKTQTDASDTVALSNSNSTVSAQKNETENKTLPQNNNSPSATEETIEKLELEPEPELPVNNELVLLFGGDIMGHSVNYKISTYTKIWKDVKDVIIPCNLAFANLEFPIDTTKEASTYPHFNSTQKYVQASIDAGFDVFSLCNNHTNDQGLDGMKETLKTVEKLENQAIEDGHKIYFSGIKQNEKDELTYNLIEKDDWTILFLPMTEVLNSTKSSEYINYIKSDTKHRTEFIEFCKNLRKDNPCDLFIISIHANEPEYTRDVTEKQEKFYKDLLDAGADVLWCNHAHIIKDRKVIVNNEKHTTKLIMYANGNTISGQRTKPDFESKNPIGERDNTGDGLFYIVTYRRNKKGETPYIYKAEPFFITTYINTAYEFVVKPLNDSFIDYLNNVERKSWAEYIKRRIKINKDATKDTIEWQ